MNHVMLEETMNILEEDEKTIIEMRYFKKRPSRRSQNTGNIPGSGITHGEKILLRMRKNMEV